jgi:SAM-dependent methyltransferase
MSYENVKPEFWESAFLEKKEMWGMDPTPSTILTKDFFLSKGVKNILIPGIGYGRNAQIFKESGMNVTGIEISKTAIEMARKHYGNDMIIYHGSLADMPYDNNKYDGIYCFGVIHLLDTEERMKLIRDCYNQLIDGGYMIFVAITKEARTYGQGKYISKDRYEIMNNGVKIYFYDREGVETEFNAYGLFEISEIIENFPFYIIKCKKEN